VDQRLPICGLSCRTFGNRKSGLAVAHNCKVPGSEYILLCLTTESTIQHKQHYLDLKVSQIHSVDTFGDSSDDVGVVSGD
jgi:hypothetical protein